MSAKKFQALLSMGTTFYAPALWSVLAIGVAIPSPATAQSCSVDNTGKCCFAATSVIVTKQGHFQSHGVGFSPGTQHSSYMVRIANSCSHNIEVRIAFDCSFGGSPSNGRDTIPPGGKELRYDVLKPGCKFNVDEVVNGKRADAPAATSNRAAPGGNNPAADTAKQSEPPEITYKKAIASCQRPADECQTEWASIQAPQTYLQRFRTENFSRCTAYADSIQMFCKAYNSGNKTELAALDTLRALSRKAYITFRNAIMDPKIVKQYRPVQH